MDRSDERIPWSKLLLRAVIVGIAAGIVSVIAQHLVVGKVHPAVTGGVVGALVVASFGFQRRSRAPANRE